MWTRNRAIIILAVIGIVLFGIVLGIILSNKKTAEIEYEADQKDPLTHDFANILPYEDKYMGNNGNLKLFQSLPLHDYEQTYHIYSDDLMYELTYTDTVAEIGQQKVEKALIYNATAALVINRQFRCSSLCVPGNDI